MIDILKSFSEDTAVKNQANIFEGFITTDENGNKIISSTDYDTIDAYLKDLFNKHKNATEKIE
jgi:hypothetical protein